MKVLLINPPFYRLMGLKYPSFPIGLCYLSSYLRENGHESFVYNIEHDTETKHLGFSKITENYDEYLAALKDDHHVIWDQVNERLRKLKPDVVGITVMTPKLASALKVAEIVKTQDDIPVIFGGPHPTIAPESILESSFVDYVVRGEGEETIVELINQFEGDGKLSEIKGLSFTSRNRVCHNPGRGFINEIDKLPFPDRESLLDVESYSPEALGWMVTSRGCPYNCTYCAAHTLWGRGVRFRSPENILAEIKHVKEKYKTKEFYFRDDSFTVNKKRVSDLCKLIREEDVCIYWGCDTRADLIDSDVLDQMKSAGCTSISLGVESGSDRILKFIKKGVTKNQLSSAAALIRKAGIQWSAFFMIGFPTETRSEIEETISFMKELDPDHATFSIVTPYLGTEIYDYSVKAGRIQSNVKWERLSHQSPHVNLTDLSKDEFREIVSRAEKIFDEHNKKKLRKYKIKSMFAPFLRFRRCVDKFTP